MNLSDPSDDDDTSSDESPVPAKRPRADTYGASSTTSHGSVLQESDEEPSETPHNNYGTEFQPSNSRRNLSDRSPENNIRLSKSSLSENCSSPDDFRPGFDEGNVDNDQGTMRPRFQDQSDFYNKKSNSNEDYTYRGEYSEKSKRMMSSMGFKPGMGLGKFEHGRVEPVEVSTQKGRRGLGLKPSVVGEIPKDFSWTPDHDKPEAKEEVLWLPSAPEEPLSADVLDEWLLTGPKKLTIDDETNFVDESILRGILEAKTIFDSLDDEDLRHARFRSNPYETIGAVIFLNRAAVKMANLDSVFDDMFTNPKRPTGEPLVDRKDILYFADVCAGPGGFSEYVLWRKGWRAKGFGFTLKGANDFKLSDFHAGSPDSFNPYYGVKEDGNIFDPANLTSLKEHVLKHTDDKGVHFLMADGGFSVEGQENIQEILSKQLYLCQCLAALMLVRTGGHFVVKLFDVFTIFSVGLIYIMYKCFDKVSVHKPVTSRPANSERYLVCRWKRVGTEPAERHLFSVNSTLWKGVADGRDVTELVPLSVIHEDAGFFDYIYKSNCLIGEKQIRHLLKIAAFSKDKSLKETSQAEMKEQCLQLWKLPNRVRTQAARLSADDTLGAVLAALRKPAAASAHALRTGALSAPPLYLEQPADLKVLRNVYDWHFVFLSSGRASPDLRIFIGCGGKRVYQLESGGWKNVVDLHLTLPAKTLIYGEIVKEYRGQGSNQIFCKALHIIDAMMLGGVDVSYHPLTERVSQCKLFCSAMNRPFEAGALPVRCKRLHELRQFPAAADNLELRALKRVRQAVTVPVPDYVLAKEMFYVVGSLLLLKEIKEPWSAQWSKKNDCKYYYCMKDKRSVYHIEGEASLDMAAAFRERAQWPWEAPVALLQGAADGLGRAHLEDHIQHNITNR